MDPPEPMRRDVARQRLAHEAVAEAVADRGRFEHAEDDGPVEVLERRGVGQAGQGDELVAVEAEPVEATRWRSSRVSAGIPATAAASIDAIHVGPLAAWRASCSNR